MHRSAPEVPLIVLADGSDKNCATQSLSQGALDYLLKGFIDTRTDLLRDSFTGLYIRDGFLTLGKRAIETAKRRKSTLVLLRMRIDNLAALRAGHGPIAVESSLREVAALLASGFRGTDIIAQRTGPLPAHGKAHCRVQSRKRPAGSAGTSNLCTLLVSQGGHYLLRIPGQCGGGVAASGDSICPVRLHPAGRSMRLRKDDSNAAIAAKSCLAIRRVWLTVNALPPRAAFTFSNPRGSQ